jgi:hypothetical protein
MTYDAERRIGSNSQSKKNWSPLLDGDQLENLRT